MLEEPSYEKVILEQFKQLPEKFEDLKGTIPDDQVDLMKEIVIDFSSLVEKTSSATYLLYLKQILTDVMVAFEIGPACMKQMSDNTFSFIGSYTMKKFINEMNMCNIKDNISPETFDTLSKSGVLDKISQEKKMVDECERLLNLFDDKGNQLTINQILNNN